MLAADSHGFGSSTARATVFAERRIHRWGTWKSFLAMAVARIISEMGNLPGNPGGNHYNWWSKERFQHWFSHQPSDINAWVAGNFTLQSFEVDASIRRFFFDLLVDDPSIVRAQFIDFLRNHGLTRLYNDWYFLSMKNQYDHYELFNWLIYLCVYVCCGHIASCLLWSGFVC